MSNSLDQFQLLKNKIELGEKIYSEIETLKNKMDDVDNMITVMDDTNTSGRMALMLSYDIDGTMNTLNNDNILKSGLSSGLLVSKNHYKSKLDDLQEKFDLLMSNN